MDGIDSAARQATERPLAERVRWKAFDRHPGLGRVHDYLDQDVARPMTLDVAARVAGLNAKYFSALFHERVGVRFIDWLHLMRTERAKRLLDRTDLPIAEIALKVGYRDLRTFERAFKKQNGRTAQQHRRRRTTPSRAGARGPEISP